MMLLEAAGVVAGYGAHDEILKGVGLSVAEGELVALIGPNGAGKSTLLKTVAGLLSPRAGSIRFAGNDIGGLRPRKIAGLGVAFVPQEANIFPSLTIRENLEIGGYVDRKAIPRRMAAVFARLPTLAERQRKPARILSGGQRQMLAVGMALMVDPKLLLLDEPSAGLSPVASEKLFETIRSIHQDGHAIVMVEQNTGDALAIADRAYLLVDGRNSRDGSAKAMAEDPDIRRIFLGG